MQSPQATVERRPSLTAAGKGVDLFDPVPSIPKSPVPHAQPLPSRSMHIACVAPALICAIAGSLTLTGVFFGLAAGHCPQMYTDP
jgi:hypothetical protein